MLAFQRNYTQLIQEFDNQHRMQPLDDPALLRLVAKARMYCNDFQGNYSF